MVRVDLSGYGYVNARVRGMRAHLLKKDFFMRLVEVEDFEALHSLLEQTAYRREVNEEVLIKPENPDFDQAFNLNLIACLLKIHDSTGGEPRKLVSLLFSRYDVENVKAILRGKKGGASPGEILNATIPVGNIKMDKLEELARQREIPDVLKVMAALRIKYARPLAQAMPEYHSHENDLAILELALDKFHFADSMESLTGKDDNVKMVRQMFTSEIDMRNISTLVRTRGIRLDDEEVLELRIPGGSLAPVQFLEIHNMGDIAQMVSEYPDPRVRKVLERALAEYQELDVVAFDRELERELTREAVGMSNLDVLGIGVIIGFIWAKQNEIINLRIVVKGKSMDQPQAKIRDNLFFVEREDGEGPQ